MAAVCVCAPCLGLRFGSVLGCSVAGELVERFTLDATDFYLVCDGRIVGSEEQLENGAVYHLEPRLRGGKGGFGSMLRALGAQIEKTTNREACRDLSGRRLRDVNHEKEMAEWLKKQSEREAEKEQRRLERIQKKLAEPKHQFTDSGFTQTCHELSERLEDSVLKGLKVDKPQVSKRTLSQKSGGPEMKKIRAGCSWAGLDELLSSDEDLEEEEEPGPSNRTSSGPSQTSSSPGSSSAPEEEKGGPESSCRPEKDQTTSSPGSSSAPEEKKGGPESSCRPEKDQTTSSPGSSSAPGVDQGGPEEDQTSSRPSQTISNPESRPAPEESQGEPESSCRQEEKQGGLEEDQERPEKNQREAESMSDQSMTTSVESSSRPKPDQDSAQELRPLDLDSVSCPEDLEVLGLNILKEELMRRGLKCGGTLSDRAARLFSVKGKRPEEIDTTLLAKTNKKQKSN